MVRFALRILPTAPRTFGSFRFFSAKPALVSTGPGSLKGIRTQHFINGQWQDSVSKKTFDTIDPETEEVIASVQAADSADVDLAVAAAKEAFKTWRDVPGPKRRDMILKLASLIEENKQFLAEVESRDNGKPVSVARDIDIYLACQVFRYYAGFADKGMQGKTIPTEDTNVFSMTVHEPVGVVGAIIPWNFPILMATWKWAPLLATGCTSVLKSSEKTPLSALLLAELTKEAGIPDGVVNVVSGLGEPAGSAIAKHPDVRKVAFTGSSPVGHKIVQYSGQSNLKKVSLELGGKSPLIILDDADLDLAVEVCHVGLFLNHGQCCCASSRILVDEKIYDKLAAMCVERAKQIKLGTGEGMEQGPQVDKVQFDKIMSYIETGKQQGANLLLGGTRHGSTGYYVQPTVFGNVTDDMTIAKEEIFGPVMQLMKFKTVEEAIQRANSTHYGLAAGVMGTDMSRCMGVAKRLEAGTVWINMYDNFDPAVPFGGYKESGWGREKSEYALENFTEVKCIQFPTKAYNA